MKIYNAIVEANKILKASKIKSSKLDSEILLSEVIDKEREYIILNPEKKICEKNYNDYKKLIKKDL